MLALLKKRQKVYRGPIENSVTIPPQWRREKFSIYGIPVNIIINLRTKDMNTFLKFYNSSTGTMYVSLVSTVSIVYVKLHGYTMAVAKLLWDCKECK